MKSFLSLVFLIGASSLFASDLLVIRGGREIRGRFLEESKIYVSFYTDYGKKIQIHKSRISVIVRNGEVLAVNPAVGTLSGIKAENDVVKDSPTSTEVPKANERSKTIEPVTQNKLLGMSAPREVTNVVEPESLASQRLGFRVGATLGLTQSYASAAFPTQSRLGAEGGVMTEFPFLAETYLQSELLLSQLGYRNGDTVYKYNFVKIPILIKYRHLLNESFSLVGMAGPSLGFRSESKSELAGVSTDLKSTTKSTIIGADLGCGTEYLFSPNLEFFFNVRYSMQLNNLDTTIGATTSVKLRQFSFLTGFLFAL